MRDPEQEPGRPTTRFAAVAVVAALVLVLASLGATSSWGPLVEVLVEAPVVTPPPPPPPTETVGVQPPGLEEVLPEPPPVPEIPDWLAQLVIAVGVAALAAVVVWFVVRVVRSVRRPELRRAGAPTGTAVEVPEIDEGEVVESLGRTLASLRAGVAVDDAIVECWHRLEAIAADSGIARGPSQTSQEFTVQILSHAVVDDAALAELVGLYRQALFSTHVLGATDRERAIECVERLAGQLGAEVGDAR